MNRSRIVKIIVIIAVVAALLVAFNMMNGKAATVPKVGGE